MSVLDGGVKRHASTVSHVPPPVKGPWYPMDNRLDGSQNQSGCGGENRNPITARNLTPVLKPTASNFTMTTITQQQRIDYTEN